MIINSNDGNCNRERKKISKMIMITHNNDSQNDKIILMIRMTWRVVDAMDDLNKYLAGWVSGVSLLEFASSDIPEKFWPRQRTEQTVSEHGAASALAPLRASAGSSWFKKLFFSLASFLQYHKTQSENPPSRLTIINVYNSKRRRRRKNGLSRSGWLMGCGINSGPPARAPPSCWVIWHVLILVRVDRAFLGRCVRFFLII